MDQSPELRGRTAPTFYVGVDLGQMRDYTAVAVVQKATAADGVTHYLVSQLQRMRVPYPDVVTHVAGLLWQLYNGNVYRQPAYLARYRADIEPTIELVVDGTGVGVAVVDLFRNVQLPGSMTAMTITGGDAVSEDGDTVRVPKRDLASVVQVLLQSKRLSIPKALDLATVLSQELQNFRVKISLTGHDSYGAGSDWREANHDDLVLAVAMACWKGENGSGEFWTMNLSEFFADAFGLGDSLGGVA